MTHRVVSSTGSPSAKASLARRLRRIEGQVRGVARMVEEERDCRELLQQLSAIRAAIQQVSVAVVRDYTDQCLCEPGMSEKQRKTLEDMVAVLSKVS
jgi:CsoR family transcriptional regulator, copper-sensing transcriptional repressor